MLLEHLLYFLLIIYSVLLGYFAKKIVSQSYEIKILEKRLSNGMTDFEKLAFIVEIYRSVNFDNLRPDQNELWMEWLNKIEKN